MPKKERMIKKYNKEKKKNKAGDRKRKKIEM